MKIYDLGICEVYINENNGKFIYSLNENYNEYINSKEFQNEYSYSYIKHLYDFDRKKYEVLLEKYNIYNSKNIGQEE